MNQVNKVEQELLDLAAETIDHSDDNLWQRATYDISIFGLMLGTLMTIAVSALAITMAQVQGSTVNVTGLYLMGVVIATWRLDRWAARVATVESVLVYYIIFVPMVAQNLGAYRASMGFIFLAVLAVVAHFIVRQQVHQKTVSYRRVAEATLMTVSRQQMQHPKQRVLPPGMGLR